MLNKNLIIFNPEKLTLSNYNLQDNICIEFRKKNTYYEKIIQKTNINTNVKDNNIKNKNIKI